MNLINNLVHGLMQNTKKMRKGNCADSNARIDLSGGIKS